MTRHLIRTLLAVTATMAATSAHAHPVVLELFTSQGCSSCPPADALLTSMQNNENVLPLSLHVDYWDKLGWKDPMSASAMTQRQYSYATALRQSGVFTPQLVVDGTASVVGSNQSDVKDAIAKAQKQTMNVPLTISASGSKLQVLATATSQAGLPDNAQVLALYFMRNSTTDVTRGENGGRTLNSINNVTRIETLAPWQAGKEYRVEIAAPASSAEGVAVLIQREGPGAILGAAKF